MSGYVFGLMVIFFGSIADELYIGIVASLIRYRADKVAAFLFLTPFLRIWIYLFI